jgi:phosphoribosylglycinamide formyltransferase-1
MSERHRPLVAILASGSGTTAEAFVRASQVGAVDADVSIVVCNRPQSEAGVYKRMHDLNLKYGLGIRVVNISGITHPKGPIDRGQTLAESEAICELFSKENISHVALMGYMRKVNGPLMSEYGYLPDVHKTKYQARMSNTHPGPLPETKDTYGVNASQHVLDLGMSMSRHTVHLVAPEIDDGPILAVNQVAIEPGDTAVDLFQRVQIIEKERLPFDIDRFLFEQSIYNAETTVSL